MRLFAEISLAVLLVTLAWKKPFRDYFGAKPPKPPPRPRVVYVTPAPVATPVMTTPRTNWMWDPNRQTVLDSPQLDLPKKRRQGQG